MKKFLGMFLAVSIVLSGIGAFAETASPAPTETPQVTEEPTVSPETTFEPTETATLFLLHVPGSRTKRHSPFTVLPTYTVVFLTSI